MKNVVFFDVDNVLVRGQTQKYLVRYLFKKRKISLVLLIKLYMWFLFYKLHLIHDVISIREKSFRVIRGWDVQYANQFFDEFFEDEIKHNIQEKSLSIIRNHIENGDEVVLLSASLLEIIQRIASHIGLVQVIATELKIEDGRYTGAISGEIPYGENKVKLAENFLALTQRSFSNAYAYADHYSDLHLLEKVKNPVAVNPDLKLRNIANKRKWLIYDI